MLKLGKYIILFLISTILLLFFSSNLFATSVNTNSINTNIIDSESSNFQNTAQNGINPISSLDTSPEANVESLDRIDYSTSSFDYTNIINILLIAVGLVIILLAIAILIRLKK